MIDESTATTDAPTRWPLMLFLAPVAAILLAGHYPETEWLAVVSVGAIFVCGGLWSVWFGDYRGSSGRLIETFAGFFSNAILTWLSGFVLVASWGVALSKVGEFWGIGDSDFTEEILSLLPVLFGLSPITGLISFGVFVGWSALAPKWLPEIGKIPVWNKGEAPWVLTLVTLISGFCLLSLFL